MCRHDCMELILSITDLQMWKLRLRENISLMRPLHAMVKPWRGRLA